MSLQAVEANILEPMQRVYLPPRQMPQAQLAQALKEYADALDGFEASDLKTAWGLVRDSHLTRSWPMPAQFVVGAKLARKDRLAAEAEKRPAAKHGEKPDYWPLWQAARASDKALQAIKLNVAWSFKCRVLQDGIKADAINLRELVSGKASAERTAQRIRQGQSHEWKGRNIGVMSDESANAALRLWEAIAQRELETQGEIEAAHSRA